MTDRTHFVHTVVSKLFRHLSGRVDTGSTQRVAVHFESGPQMGVGEEQGHMSVGGLPPLPELPPAPGLPPAPEPPVAPPVAEPPPFAGPGAVGWEGIGAAPPTGPGGVWDPSPPAPPSFGSVTPAAAPAAEAPPLPVDIGAPESEVPDSEQLGENRATKATQLSERAKGRGRVFGMDECMMTGLRFLRKVTRYGSSPKTIRRRGGQRRGFGPYDFSQGLQPRKVSAGRLARPRVDSRERSVNAAGSSADLYRAARPSSEPRANASQGYRQTT
ncbi:MAG: hypothetical protein RJA70_3491 [Pseudomonadota bacterium]|jgi:hypothetical protein